MLCLAKYADLSDCKSESAAFAKMHPLWLAHAQAVACAGAALGKDGKSASDIPSSSLPLANLISSPSHSSQPPSSPSSSTSPFSQPPLWPASSVFPFSPPPSQPASWIPPSSQPPSQLASSSMFPFSPPSSR